MRDVVGVGKSNTNTALKTALSYIERGWQPVPVGHKAKKPLGDEWQNREKLTARTAPKWFNGGALNIGVQLGAKSDGLTDVDLDVREAIVAAPLLLPKTNAKFGRASKQQSHWLYKTGLASSIDKAALQFHDPDEGTMLLELRIGGGGKGAQSVFPGSVHGSGEAVEWADNGEPAKVDDAMLVQQVKRLAAVVLLAQRWPGEGNRHDAALTVGGFLARAGFDEKAAKLMLKAIAKAAGDSEVKDREDAARDAVRGFCGGEKTAGYPKLAATFDDNVAQCVAEWLGYDEARQGTTSASDAAPTPTPMPERPWPVMDPAAYHGLAGKVVELYAPHTEADRNALLLHFLAFYGNAIDRKVFQWIDGNKHHGNIFILIAGDSGISRKGTAAARMREFIRLVDPIWVDECIKGGASSGEGIIFNIRDAITKTKESGEVVVVDEGVDDKRLLLLETEFGSVLTVMKREQNILSHILRQAWDSGVLQTLVKNNPNRCVEPHVSLVGHVTIEELRHQLDQISMANGLCNRLLIACTRRAQLLPFGSSPDQTEVATLASEVKIAFHRVYLVNKELTMVQPDARALWDRIYSELHHNSKPGLAGAIVARSDAQTKRLAALYALLDGVDDIRVEHLTAARAVTKFCEASADFIFGDTVGERTADEIQRSLRASGSMTRTDIYRAFACNVSSAKIGAALAMLERLGRARREMRPPPPGTKGRPTEFWVAV